MKVKNTLALLLAGLMVGSMASCAAQGMQVDGNADTNNAVLAGTDVTANSFAVSGVSDEEGAITLTNVTTAKNIILLIGDGMGPEQIKAGEIYKGEALTMQGFPYKTTVETRSASDVITD